MSLMVDSGAYTVWKSGGSVSISLDEYIAFCKRYPEVSYYVNLDVIPGKSRDSFVPYPVVEEAAEQGWRNYLRMIKELPMEKVIPVFHQGDSFRWLEKYLDHGAPYIGVSPNDKLSIRSRYDWVKTVKEAIPRDRMVHGFGVGAPSLLKIGWTSVDNAAWAKMAAMGQIFVPKKKNGKWDFSRRPFVVIVATKPRYIRKKRVVSPSGGLLDLEEHDTRLSKWGPHYSAFPEQHRKIVDEWLSENGMPLGEFEEVTVEDGYKPTGKNDAMGEYFIAPNKIVRRKTEGVMTSSVCRSLMNIKFLLRYAKEFRVEKYYFGGIGPLYRYGEIVGLLTDRLFSYAFLRDDPGVMKRFKYHLELERAKGETGHVGGESKEGRGYRDREQYPRGDRWSFQDQGINRD